MPLALTQACEKTEDTLEQLKKNQPIRAQDGKHGASASSNTDGQNGFLSLDGGNGGNSKWGKAGDGGNGADVD